jgi:hypothetical protein
MADLQFGLLHENLVKKGIDEKFGEGFEKTEDPFHPWDFTRNSTEFIELKTRRCNHNTYPTTMVGYNKIKYAQSNPEATYKILFKFKDGLYSYDLDPTAEYAKKTGGRCDRGKPEFAYYCYIPIENLIKV